MHAEIELATLDSVHIRNPGLGGTVRRFLCWGSLSGGSGIRSSSLGVFCPDRSGGLYVKGRSIQSTSGQEGMLSLCIV